MRLIPPYIATGKQDVPYDPMIEWVYDPMYTPPHEMPEAEAKKGGKHKCICSIQQLMQSGCICKGE